MVRAAALVTGLTMLAACAPAPSPPDTAVIRVVSVVDGDTIEVAVAGRTESVRLLGIDTPETVDPNRPVGCFGPEASARAEELLPVGTEVVLQRDVEGRDHFGRLLAYVFRADDDTFVNEALLVGGYAEVLVIEPNGAYAARFRQAEAEARAAAAGLWGSCPDAGR